VDVDPVPMPGWLADLLRPEPVKPASRVQVSSYTGDSIIHAYNAAHTWADVLVPHGWVEVGGGWRHPTATAPHSATISKDSLYVYSSNTPFEQTLEGEPHGYDKFDAYAVLNHAGDKSAAARALRAVA
jgi:hypothetical protein